MRIGTWCVGTGQKGASLVTRLTALIAAVILAGSVLATLAAFLQGFKEANDLQDGHLREVSQLAASLLSHTDRLPSGEGMDLDPDDRVVVSVVSSLAQIGRVSPGGSASGFVQLLAEGREWRALVTALPQGRLLVVRQATEARDEIARHSALMAMLPLLGLIPVLMLLVRFVVRRTFLPVQHLAEQLDGIDPERLGGLPTASAPLEIRPFVASVNAMMDKVRLEQVRQRRFIADAAHELRTPMAALSLQADNLRNTALPGDAAARLQALQDGLRRSRHLLEQLLSLSRLQDAPAIGTPAAASFASALSEVVADLHPLAAARQIDLGQVTQGDVLWPCSGFELQTLLRNVLSNALRHTPQGGQVNVGASADAAGLLLFVDDSGPGIDPAQASLVFEPFHKAEDQAHEGTGLGLAIVRAIAGRMGAEVGLVARPDGQAGCRFWMTLRHRPA